MIFNVTSKTKKSDFSIIIINDDIEAKQLNNIFSNYLIEIECKKKENFTPIQLRVELLKQAKSDLLYFDHDEIGYNYRMTNLQAALGLAQLEQIEKFISVKKNNYEYYNSLGIKLLPFRKNIRPNYWFYSYKAFNRDKLITYLNENKIQSRPVWKLIHTLRPYEQEYSYKIEKADVFYNCIVNLPCSSNLKIVDVERVADSIKKFENNT